MSNEDDNNSYQAISCADYSKYELWIMHRESLKMTWKDETGQEHLGILRPLDLRTRNKQEFLIAQLPQGDNVQIRLDMITSCNPV
jgi:transcriptional antiterminator Rof (Rho-off)